MIRRLRADTAGIALIEFAIVMPVLLTLMLGCYQLADAIACNRKVTITARAIADLVSRSITTSPTELDSALGASQQIMAPYSATNAQLRVSSVAIDAAGNARVQWSRTLNGTALVAGSAMTLPVNMATPSSTLIVGEVNYDYTPIVGKGFIRRQTLAQTIYMVPRQSDSVTCDTCS